MTVPSAGIIVKNVIPGSPAYAAGIRKQDRIMLVNGHAVETGMEFSFYSSTDALRIAFLRNGARRDITVNRQPGMFLGVEIRPRPVRRCTNNCLFCFIDQLPAGLRKSLYVKDEDYIQSFTYGNYITCTGLRQKDITTIARLGLSPLYISVHATDKAIRNYLLGNPSAPDILDRLSQLATRGISFHTQIVVCCSINDGSVLEKSISDLCRYEANLRSIAIVPVGLTKFHTNGLRLPTFSEARSICATVGRISDAQFRHDRVRKIFLADEFFLLAKSPVPPGSYYESYPQLENGVGLIRSFQDAWHRARRKIRGTVIESGRTGRKRIAVVTSVLAAPMLQEIAAYINEKLQAPRAEIIPVANSFFGHTVTVAGLLCAKDIIAALRKCKSEFEYAVVPGIIFNTAGYTLDSYSVRRMQRESGLPIKRAESISDLVEYSTGEYHGHAN
ncbi:MAG: DUF512 domain-containing protein [Chitinivibrionales bacterium]|nr:DUF512 domain-containing protein [Chitinivibrionales bacterium]